VLTASIPDDGDSKTFDMSVNFYETARPNTPEKSDLYTHHCENMKSHQKIIKMKPEYEARSESRYSTRIVGEIKARVVWACVRSGQQQNFLEEKM
jgi:hypothetical protein